MGSGAGHRRPAVRIAAPTGRVRRRGCALRLLDGAAVPGRRGVRAPFRRRTHRHGAALSPGAAPPRHRATAPPRHARSTHVNVRSGRGRAAWDRDRGRGRRLRSRPPGVQQMPWSRRACPGRGPCRQGGSARSAGGAMRNEHARAAGRATLVPAVGAPWRPRSKRSSLTTAGPSAASINGRVRTRQHRPAARATCALRRTADRCGHTTPARARRVTQACRRGAHCALALLRTAPLLGSARIEPANACARRDAVTNCPRAGGVTPPP